LVLITVIGAYFGGRSLEKVKKWKSLKGCTQMKSNYIMNQCEMHI
jgi:hypothetical protein